MHGSIDFISKQNALVRFSGARDHQKLVKLAMAVPKLRQSTRIAEAQKREEVGGADLGDLSQSSQESQEEIEPQGREIYNSALNLK